MNKVDSGTLEDGWSFLEPKEIRDPDEKKPDDWVDEAEIDDPEDKKPEGHDDIPAKIADPKATKPDDWDDESDGEWEAPQIDNPLITDDIDTAKAAADKLKDFQDGEKKQKEEK